VALACRVGKDGRRNCPEGRHTVVLLTEARPRGPPVNFKPRAIRARNGSCHCNAGRSGTKLGANGAHAAAISINPHFITYVAFFTAVDKGYFPRRRHRPAGEQVQRLRPIAAAMLGRGDLDVSVVVSRTAPSSVRQGFRCARHRVDRRSARVPRRFGAHGP